MQGPPPTSPAYNMAPPIKKQRGGPDSVGPPQAPPQDASAQRRAQLASLRAGYSNRPTMGPPPQGRGTIPNIGFNPGAATAKQSAVINGGSSHISISTNSSSSRPNATSTAQRPSIPVRAPNFARQSDIFPSAPKAETPAVARRLDVAFQEPSPPPVTTTGGGAPPPPLVSERRPPATPAVPKVSFSASTMASSPTTPAGSMSSPTPVTSPPETPYPRQAATSNGTTAAKQQHAGHTPFPGKAVPTSTHMSPSNYSNTYDIKAVHFAGQTPHPKTQQLQQQHAGQTPHPKAAAATAQEVPSTNRRQKLAQMRNIADTPPSNKSTSNTNRTTVVSFAPSPDNKEPEHQEASPELRLQRQLEAEIKTREQLLRRVAELEDELTQHATQARSAATGSKVSFMPPASPVRSKAPVDRFTSPSKRRVATPYPKLEKDDAKHVDEVYYEMAAEDVPYKFEANNADNGSSVGEDAVQAEFLVRRPHGLADLDQEFWFGAGEKNAKLYKRDATVIKEETIEVAVKIGADESTLVLFNAEDFRHSNTLEGIENRYTGANGLGMVAYIDVDANEKEYSLDDLAGQAMDVRKHYCESLKGLARGLQRQAREGGGGGAAALTPRSTGPPIPSPGSEGLTPAGAPKTDACVGTDNAGAPPQPETTPRVPPTPPALQQEPGSDVFSVLIGMVASIVYSLIKLPFVAAYTLFRWALVVIFAFGIYLLMLNTMGLTGVAPPLYYYHNPPGIM